MVKKITIPKLIQVFFLAIFLANYWVKNSWAESGLSLIRDAETEKFLRDLANPIFEAAGLNPQNIKIYIINDDSVNAFVSGGQNMFINTGLIRKFATPDALIGVIAHETGHISGGHLARASEGAQSAENAMLLSYLLGIGAMIGGSADAGQALILGGSQTAQRLYMRFTRQQEEAADQYAIEYLDQLSYPADGLIKLLESFEREMIGYKDQIDEYLLSHPVSKKRIDLIKARTAGKKFSDQKINHKLQKSMDSVLAKLEGFIENPDYLLRKYQNQHDEQSNYIKSIAFFRKGMIDQALKLLDGIIEQNKNDGFLLELKGQVLFESGRVEDSLLAYNQALKLLNQQDSGLAKISFATAILALKQNDEELIRLAIKRLEQAKERERENPFLFKQLANSYSKINDEGRSLLALAEFNLLIGNKEKCTKYAKLAKEKLDGSAKEELLHAEDLLEESRDEKNKKA